MKKCQVTLNDKEYELLQQIAEAQQMSTSKAFKYLLLDYAINNMLKKPTKTKSKTNLKTTNSKTVKPKTTKTKIKK